MSLLGSEISMIESRFEPMGFSFNFNSTQITRQMKTPALGHFNAISGHSKMDFRGIAFVRPAGSSG
jgi:hypothetical protein